MAVKNSKESGKKKSGILNGELIEKDSAIDLTSIKSEVNFLVFPFFSLTRKELRKKIETEYRDVVERNGKKMEIFWQVTANAKYGFPGPLDKKVHRAIEQLINERGWPVTNPITFSIYQLAKMIGIKNPKSGRVYQLIKQALERIVFTGVKSGGTFYHKGKKHWLEKAFHLYDQVIFKGEALPDGSIAETNYLYLSEPYLESLNAFYIKPLDYRYYWSLKREISRRLYEVLGVKFYGLKDSAYVRFDYFTLCQLLPIAPKKQRFRAKEQLKRHHEELVKTGFLRQVRWGEAEEKWIIYYYPGQRALEEIKKARLKSRYSQMELPFSHEEEMRVKLLVEDILEVTGDRHSEAFYRKIVKLLPEDLVRLCISETKYAGRMGRIRRSRARYFTDLIKRMAKERGIELSLKVRNEKERVEDTRVQEGKGLSLEERLEWRLRNEVIPRFRDLFKREPTEEELERLREDERIKLEGAGQ